MHNTHFTKLYHCFYIDIDPKFAIICYAQYVSLNDYFFSEHQCNHNDCFSSRKVYVEDASIKDLS